MTEEKETINKEEETLDHNTTLATLKMDNIYPLEEIWINLKTSISQKLTIQESADKKKKTLVLYIIFVKFFLPIIPMFWFCSQCYFTSY